MNYVINLLTPMKLANPFNKIYFKTVQIKMGQESYNLILKIILIYKNNFFQKVSKITLSILLKMYLEIILYKKYYKKVIYVI